MTTVPATATSASAQFDLRPFGRMFWKEYRQQRALWLAILALGLIGQLVLRLVLPLGREVVEVLFSVPLSMPVFYLIGSSAMLFALEREERTSDWLVSLAAPPKWTLLAKCGFTFVSTLTLSIVMLLWAMVLTLGERLPLDDWGAPEVSVWWGSVAVAIWFGAVLLFFFAWGTLGSLTGRRVVEAVPLALLWWLLIPSLPMAAFALWCSTFVSSPWFPADRDRYIGIGMGVAFLVVLITDVWLGWRWCRGQYVDAGCLDNLNERLTARWGWRTKRVSRVLARVESEFSGWRVWQRLVWQERHRESLHRLLLAVVCAVAVMLPLFSLFQRDSITFAIIGLIAILPVSMGVLGFRFDVQGQQLRFLANRGVSPLAIWLAKHAVWLPRACWIPVVCWGVAWLAEWMLIPGAFDTSILEQNYLREGRHHVMFVTGKWLPHWQTVMWFILLSYGAGQLASLLLRRFVLAAAVSLMLVGLLAGWLALMAHLDVPLWWSSGCLVVWMLVVTKWYSHHWLLERQTWAVTGCLAAALLFPPFVVAGVVANYRWLEVPGPVLNSRWLFALLYLQEAERRAAFGGEDGGLGEPLKAEIEWLQQPVPPDEREALEKLRVLLAGLNSVKVTSMPWLAAPTVPEMVHRVGNAEPMEVDTPADALDATRDQRLRAEFWAANESRIKEIAKVVASQNHCRGLKLNLPREDLSILHLPQRLLLEAGRLRTDEGRPEEALDYYCAALRMAQFVSEGDYPIHAWSLGNSQQNEILTVLVEWSNRMAAANKSLLPAIGRIRDELARFPSIQTAVVHEHVIHATLLPEWLAEPDIADHAPGAYLASFLPTEFVRTRRVKDQKLFWQWHHIRSFETFLQQPGVNAPRMHELALMQDGGLQRDERQSAKTPLAWMSHSTFDHSTREKVVNRVATIRLTLLAMTLLEWKRVHGAMPDYLENLAPFVVADGRIKPERVLPVMSLNDPWTGEKFLYSGAALRAYEAKYGDLPFIAIYSEGPLPEGQQATASAVSSVNAKYPDVLDYTSFAIGVRIQSGKGTLSLVTPPIPNR